jgi:hypothetical protein
MLSNPEHKKGLKTIASAAKIFNPDKLIIVAI